MYIIGVNDEFHSLLVDVQNRVLCGERVSQMTKTYNDVEAVTRLLDEKEKDLELAARIGQGLLARNKALEERLVTVEVELTPAHDTVTQLKHDLLLKSELLQIYTNDFDDSSPEGVRAFTCDLLQRRVKGLEDANRKLRAEASQLASDSTETELREEQILQNLANQLAEANNHIKNQDDELANKYEESCKQREEITSLIGQLVSQKHKIRELTLENEELVLQLRVVRDCQNELAAELSDYKEKYAECLAMMRETQEQLKQQNKRSLPTASNVPNVSGLSRGASTTYHPDSLASELELSSLGSDGWPSDFSLPPPTNHTANHSRHPFQRVFDTVRCAGQSAPVSLPLAPGTPSSSGPPRVTMHTSTPLSETCPPPLLKAQSVLAKLTSASESEYPATSKIGVPGTPGTVDLIHALRRLTPKTSGAYCTATAADSHGWKTPDSIMSTGSRSALSSMNSFQCNPERLKIIKPMEGSTTLHNWSRLATPHLGSLLEDRPGVATRETDSRRLTSNQPVGLECTGDLLEYSLFDVEEDEELEYPYGNYTSTGATYTNSAALRSDTLTRATSSSIPSAYMTLMTDYPSLDPSINAQLAHNTAEKGSNARAYSKSADVLDTPNNSPDITAPGTPPSYYGAFSLLQQGAKMIRRTWTGEETPYSPDFHAVPRISMKELEVLADMNLMEKLEKLGLDEVAQHSSAISPTALFAALESLAFSNCYASLSEPATTLEPAAASMRRNNSAQSMEDGATTAKKSPLHRSTSHSIPLSSGLNVICDIGSPLDSAASCASAAACFDEEQLAKTVDGPSAFYVARDSHFAAAPGCRVARVGQI